MRASSPACCSVFCLLVSLNGEASSFQLSDSRPARYRKALFPSKKSIEHRQHVSIFSVPSLWNVVDDYTFGTDDIGDEAINDVVGNINDDDSSSWIETEDFFILDDGDNLLVVEEDQPSRGTRDMRDAEGGYMSGDDGLDVTLEESDENDVDGENVANDNIRTRVSRWFGQVFAKRENDNDNTSYDSSSSSSSRSNSRRKNDFARSPAGEKLWFADTEFPLPRCSAPERIASFRSKAKDESTTKQEVTLVTQCSLDRLDQLAAQLSAWSGRASVAIYLQDGEATMGSQQITDRIKESVFTFLSANQKENIAVSVVRQAYGGDPYPINYLRNVALLQAGTSGGKVLLVDVDFIPSENLYRVLHEELYSQEHDYGCSVIVCPAFELLNKDETRLLPVSLQELKECVDMGEAEGFHLSTFPAGHGPTDFDQFWQRSLPGVAADCYQITYQENFEPYVVMPFHQVPLYDERFQGYGLNKIAHLASVAAQQPVFHVLPGAFLIARAHQRSNSWKQLSQSANRRKRLHQLYDEFKVRLRKGQYPVVTDVTRRAYIDSRTFQGD